MGRVMVYGETRERRRRWLAENGLSPRQRDVYEITGGHSGRGFNVEPEDRVVFVGLVGNRPDFWDTLLALIPTLHEVGKGHIEWVA